MPPCCLYIFKMRIFGILTLVAIGLGVLTGCSGTAKHHRPQVVVSIPPQRELLGAIAGDSVDIITLLRADSDAETFELSVADMRKVAEADLYVTVGHILFEHRLLDGILAGNPDFRHISSDDGVSLIYGTHDHGDHTHETADPHTWFSVRNLRVMAANMLNALCDIDPANEGYYNANFKALDSRLDSIDRSFAGRIAGAAVSEVVVWHPSLSYFTRDYNLTQTAIGEQNKETTIGMMRDRIERVSGKVAVPFFIQAGIDPSQIQNIVNELNLEPVVINPQDADYEAQFNLIADAITDSQN